MFTHIFTRRATLVLTVLAGMFSGITALAQSTATTPKATSANPRATGKRTSPYRSAGTSMHAKDYYELTWGVNALSVRSAESGELIRFNYRVINAEKAKILNDKKNQPYLLDETTHVKLIVPSLEKVGQLRQTSSTALEEGKIYWMAFSNRGGRVRVGDRVSVVIGNFRADGLVIQ